MKYICDCGARYSEKSGVVACCNANHYNPVYCNWTEAQQPDGDTAWDTGCGNTHTLISGSPADNALRYCCYCGEKIAQRSLQPNAEAKRRGHQEKA